MGLSSRYVKIRFAFTCVVDKIVVLSARYEKLGRDEMVNTSLAHAVCLAVFPPEVGARMQGMQKYYPGEFGEYEVLTIVRYRTNSAPWIMKPILLLH